MSCYFAAAVSTDFVVDRDALGVCGLARRPRHLHCFANDRRVGGSSHSCAAGSLILASDTVRPETLSNLRFMLGYDGLMSNLGCVACGRRPDCSHPEPRAGDAERGGGPAACAATVGGPRHARPQSHRSKCIYY